MRYLTAAKRLCHWVLNKECISLFIKTQSASVGFIRWCTNTNQSSLYNNYHFLFKQNAMLLLINETHKLSKNFENKQELFKQQNTVISQRLNWLLFSSILCCEYTSMHGRQWITDTPKHKSIYRIQWFSLTFE